MKRLRLICQECGKELSYSSTWRGAKLCKGCTTRHTWTGRHLSEMAKKKISLAKTGHPLSEEHRAKLRGKTQSHEAREKNRVANSGPNNARWKGGRSNERDILEGSAKYKSWRKAVFMRDNYICRSCAKRGGHLNAHHLLPFSKYPEHRMKIDNGMTLCLPCHQSLHQEVKMVTSKFAGEEN